MDLWWEDIRQIVVVCASHANNKYSTVLKYNSTGYIWSVSYVGGKSRVGIFNQANLSVK